jgi:ADP-ribosylarginine hydrolase
MLMYGISDAIYNYENGDLIENIKINMQKIVTDIYDDSQKNIYRALMLTTYENVFIDMRNKPYNAYTGGSGPATRSVSIGSAYYGIENRKKLIDVAINSAKITHNSPIGYLGAVTSALFSAFAIEKINILRWPYELINILKSEMIRKYIDKNDEYINDDYNNYIAYWQKYIDLRFEDNRLITTKANKNLVYRSRFHYDHFTKNTKGYIIGDSGYSSTIMAYDCLIDAGDKWEKLIIYSAVHWGSANTVASIAAFWFGLLYGFNNIPKNNLEYVEFKNDLIEISNKFYSKFYK